MGNKTANKINSQSGFLHIDKVLANTAKQYRLEQAQNRYQVIKHWQEAAGEFLEETVVLTKAVDFKSGVLKVACLSHNLVGRLKLLAPRIIEVLNRILGRPLVYAITFEL